MADSEREYTHVDFLKDDNGDFYYCDELGNRLKGVNKVNGFYYLFGTVDGVLKVEWQTPNDKRYYYSPKDGNPIFGFIKYHGKFYYVDYDKGKIVSETITIDGLDYTFDENGVLTNDIDVDVKDKLVTLESIGILHLYAENNYLKAADCVGKYWIDSDGNKQGEIHGDLEGNQATKECSFAGGFNCLATNICTFAIGNYATASGNASASIGQNTEATGDYSFAANYFTKASGLASHAEGYQTEASGEHSHAEGYGTIASNWHSHAEGYQTKASNTASHAEGYQTKAFGEHSHAEGSQTEASGENSHAEGYGTIASKYSSHAEGHSTTASGERSHAEGHSTTASGEDSHAEGYGTKAYGDYSHAEGFNTKASGNRSHAEGTVSIASGLHSHAEGLGTIASGDYQHVQGKYNKESISKYIFIIGNGASDTVRSNAFSVDWSGKIYVNNATEGVDVSVVSNNVNELQNRFNDAYSTKIIYVDAVNGSDTQDGSTQANALQTLSRALQCVQYAKKAVIYLAAGEYTIPDKTLNLLGQDVRIYGDAAATTIIKGNIVCENGFLYLSKVTIDNTDGESANTTSTAVISQYNGNIRLANCIVNANSKNAVGVSDMSNVCCSNTEFKGNAQYAVYVTGQGDAKIYYCTNSTVKGVYSGGNSMVRITQNEGDNFPYTNANNGMVFVNGQQVLPQQATTTAILSMGSNV
ncbi:MAG TPA: hypothetical protein DCW90_23595 [Lachnospiraceae bacterium]|nr:hypothetical protein [Lachnospiraceae bacterium]